MEKTKLRHHQAKIAVAINRKISNFVRAAFIFFGCILYFNLIVEQFNCTEKSRFGRSFKR
jgi:hypothetical protein